MGEFGTDSFLVKLRRKTFHVVFVGKRMVMDIYFGSVPFPPPLQHVRELPEFAFLMSLDRSRWPRCLLWHGWLPGLSGLLSNGPWTLSFGELASFHLERRPGAYPVGFDAAWTPPDWWWWWF